MGGDKSSMDFHPPPPASTVDIQNNNTFYRDNQYFLVTAIKEYLYFNSGIIPVGTQSCCSSNIVEGIYLVDNI